MKKITVLFLIAAILCSSVPVSFADDYRDQVLPLLAEKLQVNPDTINLEGDLLVLPLSGKQLWMGRYYTGEMAAETPLYDDPDTPVSSDEVLAGVVYLEVSTGELLSDEEARIYFEEEDKLRQVELERLASQSGKIDPYFDGKILDAEAGDLFEVIIWLRYQETASMKEAIDEILKDYPDLVEKGLVPPEFYGGSLPLEPRAYIDSGDGGGYSGSEQGEAEGTRAVDLPASEAATTEEFHILPYPEAETLPLPEEKVQEEERGMEDIDWARYEEMINRLMQVHAGGYSISLEAVEQTLKQMGISYEVMENNMAVACTLTAEQLQSLKDADYIESISENVPVYALDGIAERTAAAQEMDLAEEEPAPFPWILIPVLLLLAGGGGLYYWQRKKRCSAVQ